MVNFDEKYIYPARMEVCEKKLKAKFKKRKDLFTQSRACEVTGSHPHQIKKWLEEWVQHGKVRKVTAYFFGCRLDELIVQDFNFGEVAICPVCNSEIPWPPSYSRGIVCANCGAEYIKHVLSDPNPFPLLYPEARIIFLRVR